MNITGITVQGNEGAFVSHNQIYDAKFGIMLWSTQHDSNTTRGLKFCTIKDNMLRMNGPGWAPLYGGNSYTNGIVRDVGSTIGFEDITIENNYIFVDNTGYTGMAGDSIGNGIEWRDPSLTRTDKRITIRSNTIDSPLAAGIRLSVIGESFTVDGNIVRNPAQASIAAGGAMSNGYGNGIIVNGALKNSRIDNNLIIDDQTTPTTTIGLYLYPTATGSVNNQASGNRVPVARSKKIDTATGTFGGNWLIKMDQETYNPLTGKSAIGSTIFDRSTAKTYTQTTGPEGTSWSQLSSGSAPLNRGSFIAANYYITPEGYRTTGVVLAANTEYAIPLWVANAGTITRIGVSITDVTSVTAGTLLRIGIRSDNGSGKPASLIVDAGTVAADAVGTPEITISQSIAAPGLYWLTATCQNAGATLPSVRMISNTGMEPVAAASLATALGSGLAGYAASGVSAALPASYTIAGYVSSAPVIALRG